MLKTLTAFLLTVAPTQQIGVCDPVDGPPLPWSAEQRAEVRDRIAATCKAVAAAPAVCAYLDVVAVRENSGSPSVRHVLGRNESGLGALGLSTRWHRDKWPGHDEDPAFCMPEAATLVALDVVRRAQVRWGADNLIDVQAIFAGWFRCVEEEGRRECFIERHPGRERDLCARLEQRGIDCRAALRKRAAGRAVPVEERPALAAELAARWAEITEPAA